MIFGLFQILSPYLEVKYFRTEQEVKAAKPENIADADIMNGYVKSTKEEQLELAKKKMISMVVKENGEEEQVVQNTLDQICSSGKSINEMSDAIGEIYGYPGGYSLRYYYEDYEYHQGTVDEINAELKAKLSEYSYSWYFGRKFADFGGLYLTFFQCGSAGVSLYPGYEKRYLRTAAHEAGFGRELYLRKSGRRISFSGNCLADPCDCVLLCQLLRQGSAMICRYR